MAPLRAQPAGRLVVGSLRPWLAFCGFSVMRLGEEDSPLAYRLRKSRPSRARGRARARGALAVPDALGKVSPVLVPRRAGAGLQDPSSLLRGRARTLRHLFVITGLGRPRQGPSGAVPPWKHIQHIFGNRTEKPSLRE